MGWPAAGLAAVSAFVRQHGKRKAIEKYGEKRVRQAVEKEIKDKPSGSGRWEPPANLKKRVPRGLSKEAAKKRQGEADLDEIIPPMRFRKKGGLIKKSSPKKSSPKKSIDGIARKGKTKAKHR